MTGALASGRSFVAALTARDFDSLRSTLAEDVRFRMLVPSGPRADAGADAVARWYAQWFADADHFEIEASSVGEVEGRVAVTYRFRLHDADGWQAIEQHLMIDVDEAQQITAIDLLCSGFRSVAVRESDRVHHYDAGDLGCAEGLAGQFRKEMQQIPVGEVLVVSTHDPAAKEDLPPLARMMGHVVRAIEAPGDGRLLVTVERGK